MRYRGPPCMTSLRSNLLKIILRNLDLYDLQSAMLVCRRWSRLAFRIQSSRMRLSIMPDIGPNVTEYQYGKLLRYHDALTRSRRAYKHIAVYWGTWDGQHEPDDIKDILFLQIIQRFQRSLVSLTIMSDGRCMTSGVMSAILESCPRLKVLNLNDMEYTSLSFDQDRMISTAIHTLHDANQVMTCYPMTPDYFTNVTTLHVMLTINNRLDDLFHKLSHQLISLTLGWDTEQCPSCIDWPMEFFPLLRTLVLKTVRAGREDQLGQFLQRMPKLKSLTLSPHLDGDISVLNWISRKNLRHLDVWPVDVSLSQFLLIARFLDLKSICIRGDCSMHGTRTDIPALNNARYLALQGYRWNYALGEFLINFPNLVKLELQTAGSWSSEDAHAINFLTSLKRLIVHEGVRSLNKFMQFCENLAVPNLSVVTKQNALICNDLSRHYIAWNIEKLSIHALKIHRCTCDHLIQSMPRLRTLELTLLDPLDKFTYHRICTEFPHCETIRHLYQPYESILNLYERLGGMREMVLTE